MEANTAADPLQEALLARRAAALEAIRKFRPLHVWAQVIVLLFFASMILLMFALAMLRPAPDRAGYFALPEMIAIFFVAGNALRTQRQVQGLVELVTRNPDAV